MPHTIRRARSRFPVRLSRWVRLPRESYPNGISKVSTAFAAWRISLWFGLLVGLSELLIIGIRSWLHDESTPGHLQLNRHAAWMIPAANTIIFGVFGIVSGLVAVSPKRLASLAATLPLGLAGATFLWMIHSVHAAASLVLAVGAACRLQGFVEKHRDGFDRLVKRSLPILLAVFGLLVLGDTWFVTFGEQRVASSLPVPASSAENVLLIVLDTVRADRTSVYGYSKDTTPNLKRLAEQGITFDQARAPSSWTLPTHASLLTGRWPFELSTRTHGPLDSTFPTLAEYLEGRGYETAGFVANTYFCNSWYGLGRGFLHYEDYPERDTISMFEVLRNAEIGQRILRVSHTALHTREGVIGGRKDARTVNGEFLSWLDKRPEPSKPFFAFLNYFDAHDPYIVFDPEAPSLGFEPPRPEDLPLLQEWHAIRGGQATPEQRRIASEAYDRCLAYLDHQLGRLFDQLERSGVLEKTTIIVTSDHGEQFGEHGIDLHGNSLYRPVVDVPLIILPAGKLRDQVAGRRIHPPVSLRCVPATVLDILGGTSASPFPGRSLARYWHPEAMARSNNRPASGEQGLTPEEDLILSETWLKLEKNPKVPKHVATPVQWGPMRSLVGEGHIYIRLANGQEELYNLEGDPGESQNLAGQADLAPLLERFRKRLAEVGWF